jgi:hypothetical protein
MRTLKTTNIIAKRFDEMEILEALPVDPGLGFKV